MLQPLYGGALARPFTTHHNALDRDLYLRIATELYLKRLIVGGLERVYELGKDFRNEGLSTKHNPEFTMLEWYEAYADYNDIASELEELVSFVAAEVEYEGPIDFSAPWKRVTLRDAIREGTGIDVLAQRDRDALVAAAKEKGIELDPTDNWAKLVDDLLSKHVEPKLRTPPSSSTTRSSCRRSRRTTAPRRAWSSGSSASRAAWSSPTPSPSSTTPTSSVPASSSRSATPPRATRRPSPTTRTTSARWSRACRPPAASAWASTGW